MLRHTPLYEEHLALKAKMVEFGGWDMPVQYTNVIEEHMATRTAAGLFDVSHMGEFIISGKDTFSFLQKMMTNDLSKLVPEKAMYSTMCYPEGGVVDDLFIYFLENKTYLVVVNASNIEKDYKWLESHIDGKDVRINDVSDITAKIDIQGPKAQEILSKFVDSLDEIKRFRAKNKSIDGVNVLVSRTGYTGEDGFELYLLSNKAPDLWRKFLKAGEPLGLKPCGLGARDTLRIESCYSLYGHEINDRISPMEANLGWQVKLNKEKDFIGKEVFAKQKEKGPDRILICFELTKRGVPRAGSKVKSEEQTIGEVTSGTFSPLFKKGIGMALVTKNPGTKSPIVVLIRDRSYPAIIVKRPFYEFMGKNLKEE